MFSIPNETLGRKIVSVRTEFLALVTNEDADRTFTELLFIVNINDELHFKKNRR